MASGEFSLKLEKMSWVHIHEVHVLILLVASSYRTGISSLTSLSFDRIGSCWVFHMIATLSPPP